MSGMEYNIHVVKSEEGLVIKSSDASERFRVFSYVTGEANVVVTKTQVDLRITSGGAHSFQEIMAQVDFLLERIEALVLAIPSTDLMKISEVTKVTHTMRLDFSYQPDGAFKKLRLLEWNVRVGQKYDDLLAGVDGTN